MANQGLLIGGVAVLGVAAYFLTQGGEEPTTLEDTQATSFVGLGGGGEADNRSQKLENSKEFLDDCATPTTTTTDATTDDGTTEQCAVPLYLANETITLEHPLAATNSDYAQYKFTVRIEADILTSMTEAAFNAAPASEFLGDYTITVERSGGWQEDRRWTANQNPDFNGSVTKTGMITKGNANDPASSVVPTWEQCLAAYGGYMPNKIGALGDEVIFRQGEFDDVGQFRYLKKTSDGEDYPNFGVNKFALDMSGNVIPLYAQMEVKCGSSWNVVGGLTQVTSANLLVGDDACYAPCYPAVLPTSGLAFGCSLPTVDITYPEKIYVICDDDAEDCSDRGTTSAGGMSADEIWNLNPAAPQQSTMQKGRFGTPSGVIHGLIFDNLGVPRVHQDSSGRWYVRYSNRPSDIVVFIDEVIPTFKAAYTRQSITCTCPSDTNLEGTTFTLFDKYSCPAGTPEAGFFAGILGGSDEWKTTYCGGLKPVYGCKDARATNYNSNPDVVKDPTDNDVCNPKYCNYASNVVLPECQGGGGLGGGLDTGGETTNPGGNTGGTDLSPSDSECPQCDGKVGVNLTACLIQCRKGSSGGNLGSGGANLGGGMNFMAENTLKPHKLINTSHSFINW
tara:strand:- start:4643 stop:6505 length:1863 start_codon:yes stop_codon:yes gene_type:complete